jgi:hypothetical protein
VATMAEVVLGVAEAVAAHGVAVAAALAVGAHLTHGKIVTLAQACLHATVVLAFVVSYGSAECY